MVHPKLISFRKFLIQFVMNDLVTQIKHTDAIGYLRFLFSFSLYRTEKDQLIPTRVTCVERVKCLRCLKTLCNNKLQQKCDLVWMSDNCCCVGLVCRVCRSIFSVLSYFLFLLFFVLLIDYVYLYNIEQ